MPCSKYFMHTVYHIVLATASDGDPLQAEMLNHTPRTRSSRRLVTVPGQPHGCEITPWDSLGAGTVFCSNEALLGGPPDGSRSPERPGHDWKSGTFSPISCPPAGGEGLKTEFMTDHANMMNTPQTPQRSGAQGAAVTARRRTGGQGRPTSFPTHLFKQILYHTLL